MNEDINRAATQANLAHTYWLVEADIKEKLTEITLRAKLNTSSASAPFTPHSTCSHEVPTMFDTL